MWSAAAVAFAILSIWVAAANLVILAGVARKLLQGSKDFSVFNTTDSIIAQIAFADFVYGVITFVVLAMSGGDTTTSETACSLSAANVVLTPVFSIFGLVLLAYCRLSILEDEEFSEGISLKRASTIAAVIWVLCLILAIYSSFTGVPAPSNLYCRRGSSVTGGVIVLLAVFAPSIAIFWYYFKIMEAVRMSTVDQKVPRAVARMIYFINLVYIVTLFPYGGTGLYVVIVGDRAPPLVDAVTLIITNLNFVSNPILYCVFQKKYRRAVFELVGIKYFLVRATTLSRIHKSDTAASINLVESRPRTYSGNAEATATAPDDNATVEVATQSDTAASANFVEPRPRTDSDHVEATDANATVEMATKGGTSDMELSESAAAYSTSSVSIEVSTNVEVGTDVEVGTNAEVGTSVEVDTSEV